MKAITDMKNMNTHDWDREVHSFKSKFKEPMQGRTWKWTLSIGQLGSEQTKNIMRALVFSYKDQELVIDVKRSAQTDGEKKMWQALQKQRAK